MNTEIQDLLGGTSDCCGASMYEDWGICSDCKEHCENAPDEPDATDDRVFTPKQEAYIAASEKRCKDDGCEETHKCHE